MKDKQYLSHETEHRVAFYELDPMQIVWHGNYFNYFEDARRALLAHCGIDLNEFFHRTQCLFPIIRTSSKHIYPLRYGDEFICKASLIEAKTKLVFDFEIRMKKRREDLHPWPDGTGHRESAGNGNHVQHSGRNTQGLGILMVEMDLRKAMMAGVERVTAWSGLLDRINVFPVADGDTGRNLMISLAPLRRVDGDMQDLARDLLFSARGNAGNIAARFFQAFLRVEDWENLPHAIRQGSDHARQAVADPQPGTMLTFFDGLAHIVNEDRPRTEKAWVDKVMDHMATVVRETTSCQPRLEKAGVVDAGALGMFLFFDGFFTAGLGNGRAFCPVASLFAGRLEVRRDAEETPESGYCVDMVLSPGKDPEKEQAALAGIGGDSMVVIRQRNLYESPPPYGGSQPGPARARKSRRSPQLGRRRSGDADRSFPQTAKQTGPPCHDGCRRLPDPRAGQNAGDNPPGQLYYHGRPCPSRKSCLTPDALYGANAPGRGRFKPSQASVYERHQSYQSAVSLYGKVLYLCVGSFFTGNYDTARQWQQDHDLTQGLEVIDTGCAAGRLGLLAALTARFAGQDGKSRCRGRLCPGSD